MYLPFFGHPSVLVFTHHARFASPHRSAVRRGCSAAACRAAAGAAGARAAAAAAAAATMSGAAAAAPCARWRARRG
eukprot:354917-Chlamydomonas_euryale.AAC.16